MLSTDPRTARRSQVPHCDTSSQFSGENLLVEDIQSTINKAQACLDRCLASDSHYTTFSHDIFQGTVR